MSRAKHRQTYGDRLVKVLETRNPHTLSMWGKEAVGCLIAERVIFPIPFTGRTWWFRPDYRLKGIFHVTAFDLVD